MKISNLKYVVLITISLVLSNCARFEQKELARLDKLPDVTQFTHKPNVYIDFKYFTGEPDYVLNELPNAADKFIPFLDEVVKDSNLFNQYYFEKPELKDIDYSIRLGLYNHGNRFLAAMAGYISGFTLGVIPGAATDNYTLVADVVDNRGKKLKSISNKDSITTWIGLWFIPMVDTDETKNALKNTFSNQVRLVLKELVDSGVLQYSYADQYILSQEVKESLLF